MGWIRRRPLLALLALLAVGILVIIGFETGFGSRLTHPVASAPPKAAVVAEAKLVPPVVAQAPEQSYPEMAARPLFTPTRRPAPVEPAAGKPAFTRGQFVLQGVIVVGDQRTALLKEKTSGKVHRVDRGQDVNGIKVEAVEPTEVTLTMNGEREKVALVVQRPGDPATRTAAPAPVADPTQQGPFTPPAAQPQTAVTQAPAGQAEGGQPTTTVNPVGRPAPAARAPATPATPGATQPTTQPMTPE